MPSTITLPVSCRVEPVYTDALRTYAELRGQTLSSAIADLIRTAVPQVTRASRASSGA